MCPHRNYVAHRYPLLFAKGSFFVCTVNMLGGLVVSVVAFCVKVIVVVFKDNQWFSFRYQIL